MQWKSRETLPFYFVIVFILQENGDPSGKKWNSYLENLKRNDFFQVSRRKIYLPIRFAVKCRNSIG